MNSIRITLLFLHIYNIFIIYNVINSKNNSLIHLLTIFNFIIKLFIKKYK